MIVLGIHDGHNASACLLKDGRIVAAVEEERVVRVKNWAGFPTQAVSMVLDMTGTSIDQVDYVALNGDHMPPARGREALMEEYRQTGSPGTAIKRLLKRTPAKRLYLSNRRRERLSAVKQAGFASEKIIFVEHHLAHASAAYFGWGRMNEDILLLTSDGGGDYLCATVSRGHNGKIERLAQVPDSESIGNIYAMVTFLMGMVPLEHEYKLMGLAPYAPDKGRDVVYGALKPILEFVGESGVTWRRANGCPETYYSYAYFKRLFEQKRFDWIAAGLQLFTEELLVAWVRNCIKETGIRKVALGGGVFMNVKANKRIMELADVDDLFIFPSCGDETNAMGAAMWAYSQKVSHDEPPPEPVQAFYFGPSVTDTETQLALQQYVERGWLITPFASIEPEVARLLAQGQVVARCKGPMEFGARALGNRSILADPTRPEVVRVINDMIKSRDFWMPFAPAILEERANDYLVNPKCIFAPYMILSFDTTSRVDELRAAIHPYDLTARPQVVRQKWNPDFHLLLSEFERLTGRGAILNTSFNLHGSPIVMTAQDALEVFDKSGLRHLALGNLLISKP